MNQETLDLLNAMSEAADIMDESHADAYLTHVLTPTPAPVNVSDIAFAHVTMSDEQHASLIARVRGVATIAALSLALLTTHASAQTMGASAPTMTACYQIADSGEGFPQVYCPLTGHAYYQDMDGTDGALGTAGDGRWVQLP